MRIAPEGWPFIASASLLAGVGLYASARIGSHWWAPASFFALLAGSMAAFFRDPVREGPRDPALVLAPADGRVVAIAEVEEPLYLRGPARRVSIFLSILDVHVNRHPVSGTVELYRHRRGRFLHARNESASDENEQASLGIRTLRGRVLVRQIAGLVARRIVTDPREGADVRQGERLGLIRFGSRVDVFLPRQVAVRVRQGDRARAGVTVLGEWPP